MSENKEPSSAPLPGKIEPKLSSFGFARLYQRVVITLDNNLLPLEKLSSPPSISDRLTLSEEKALRFLGCELIQTACILLKLPQVAAATGQLLYQRFYYAKSFVRCDFEAVAMACICLASKIEESPRKLRDIINVFNHIKQLQQKKKPAQPMILDQKYVLLKNDVKKQERRVLKELGFCVHVKHPHKLIVTYLKLMDLEDDEKLLQKSWNYMNDGLRTDIFLRYPPETIACACIYLSARVCKVPLPNNWWEVFDATEKECIQISATLLRMYDSGKPNRSHLEARVIEERKQIFDDGKLTKPNEGSGGEATPNPSTQKFSPSQASRTASPSKRELSQKHESSKGRSESDALSRAKESRSSKTRNSEKQRDRRSVSGSPEDSRARQKNYSKHRDSREQRKHRDPSPVPTHKHKRHRTHARSHSRSRSQSPTPRERDYDREKEKRRQRDRERELEVRETLGKRRRSTSRSPPEQRKVLKHP